MTFLQAKKKLSKIAAGKYHSVKFELMEHQSGNIKTECSLYVAGSGHHSGSTWEKAFDSLKSLKRTPAEMEAMAPQMDVAETDVAQMDVAEVTV